VGAVVAAVGLAASGAAAQDGGGRPALSPAAQAKADSGRPPFTAADVHFMQGMISHHAQAVVMAGWAPLTMVEQLFGSEGAAQDDKIFKFASDVGADQTAEIDRMTIMLGLPPASATQASGQASAGARP
jgi:uncharacterized protein (DUF305 family)